MHCALPLRGVSSLGAKGSHCGWRLLSSPQHRASLLDQLVQFLRVSGSDAAAAAALATTEEDMRHVGSSH